MSFHSAQPTNDEVYPLDDGFFLGVNCQPDLLQRFWGEVYSRLLNCRLVECQETKALARTSAAD